MPYQAAFDLVFQHALHNLVGTFVLLVAAHHLDALTALVGSVGGEVVEDVEQGLGRQQLPHFGGDVFQAGHFRILAALVEPPGRPELQRRAHGTVEQFASFGGEAEHVGHKEFGHAVLVAVVDVGGGIEPRNRRPHGRFGLAHHQGEAVDKQHDVGAFGLAVADAELVDQLELVVGDMPEVDEADGHVGVVLAEGHGLVALEPLGELLVGAHEAGAVDRQQDGTQLEDDLIGAFGLCGNLGVEADEGLFHFRFHHHPGNLARQLRGGQVLPLCPVRRLRFVRHAGFIQIHSRHRMDDEVFHCVYFVEGHKYYFFVTEPSSLNLYFFRSLSVRSLSILLSKERINKHGSPSFSI